MESQEDIGQTAAGVPFCKKMKHKLHDLHKMGKLMLSHGSKRGNDILDLTKGSFSSGCRKVSGIYDYLVIFMYVFFNTDLVFHDYLDDQRISELNDSSKCMTAMQVIAISQL